jgi:2'-5' RNA ligase
VRCFIAINLDAAARDAIVAATAPLRAAAPAERWVPAARLHITARFIGEQDAAFVGRLETGLREAARRYDPIPVELKGVGAFPTFRRARVIWVGVGYDPKLELLHHDMEVACMALGLEVEGRPFRPHVTLARLATPGGDAARAIRAAARDARVRASTTVETIDVMESVASEHGREYRRLAALPLGRTR